MFGTTRWIGLLVWGAALLVVAFAVRAAWPEKHVTRAYVVLLGDSQGVEATTEVAYQGVAVGDVKSVRLYASVDEGLRQRVRAFVLSLPREEGKTWPPDRAIVAEVLLDTAKVSLDRPLFADIVHSKFTGRAQVDLLARTGAPVPAETGGPFLLGPFVEPSNLAAQLDSFVDGVLSLSKSVDDWWKANGPARLDRMGDGIARTADRLEQYEAELLPPDDEEGPVDRLKRGLHAFAERIPSREGPPTEAELLPGVRTFREETLPSLIEAVSDIQRRATHEWSDLVEDAWDAAGSLRGALEGLVEALGRRERAMRETLDKAEGGMVKDLLGGEGK